MLWIALYRCWHIGCEMQLALPNARTTLKEKKKPLRSLRSCDGYKAIVPRAHKVRLGDRAFSIIESKLWNSLPISIRSAPSISNFKSLLKTHFFRLAYHYQKKNCMSSLVQVVEHYTTSALNGAIQKCAI